MADDRYKLHLPPSIMALDLPGMRTLQRWANTLPWDIFHRGVVARDEITASAGSIGTTATNTGLQIDVTLVAGRRYKLSVQGGLDNAVASAQIAAFYITDGSNNLIGAVFQGPVAANGSNGDQIFGSAFVDFDTSPTGRLSAGANTFKVRANFTSGAANFFLAAANNPAILLLEDIGRF